MADTLSCQRETLHSQQLKSIKKSIDSDHGIYRDLRDVVAKYPFERSHRFPVIQPNSGRRDYSRSSCDGGRRSSGPVPGSRQDACAGRNGRDFLPIPFGLPASVALPPCGE
jgi:hypothetical protein